MILLMVHFTAESSYSLSFHKYKRRRISWPVECVAERPTRNCSENSNEPIAAMTAGNCLTDWAAIRRTLVRAANSERENWSCLCVPYRLSTPFEAVGVLLMLVATMFALVGHFNSDHKTLVACGLYILGGKQCSPLSVPLYNTIHSRIMWLLLLLLVLLLLLLLLFTVSLLPTVSVGKQSDRLISIVTGDPRFDTRLQICSMVR